MQLNKILYLSLIISLLCSCVESKTSSDEQVFHYNQVGGISSLDPAFAKNQANMWTANQLYNSLLQFDDELNIIPSIAKSWEISDDGLTYTFHLRDDVYFHDDPAFPEGKGRRVTANDFVYSFNRLLDPQVASPGSWIFSDKIAESDPFVAPDDTTFIVRLLRPFRPMMGILTMQYTSVVPKEAAEYYGKEFRRNPVGTGPFRFKSWTEDEALILERNPNYWEKDDEGNQLPYIDEVVVSFIENKGTEFLAFLNGDLDFVSDIDPGLKDRILTLEGDLQEKYQDKVRLVRAPYLNLEYFGFMVNPENGAEMSVVQQEKIRQAINYGFDRKKMIRFMRNNKGMPANAGVIPYGLPVFDSTVKYGYEYDPVKARKLLTEAGFPGGKGLPLIKLYAPSTYMDLAEFIQNQLKQTGINLAIEVTQGGILRNMMEDGEAEFFRASWIADYPDAESFLAMFYSPYGAPPNYTRFKSEYYDRLYERAVQENNDSLRYEIYREMDSIVMANAAVVPLYYDQVYRFVQNNVQGLGVNAMNLLVLKNVKINE